MDKLIIVCYLKYLLSISSIYFFSCGIQNDSLYDQDLVTFEEGNTNYNHSDAEGFIKLNALRLMINKLKQD